MLAQLSVGLGLPRQRCSVANGLAGSLSIAKLPSLALFPRAAVWICIFSWLAMPTLVTAVAVADEDDGVEVVSPVAGGSDETGHSDDSDHSHDGDDAHADGDHGDGHDAELPPILSFDPGQAFWNLVIFVCVMAILSIFVWPSVLGGLQAREEKIREDLEAAENANAEAQEVLASYQSKLDEAATQVQSMLSEARKDAEAAGAKIVDEAKAEAAAQRDRAVADIENAKKVALADLAQQTSGIAMQVARGVVGRELTSSDHSDLIQQAMERLPSNN